VGRITALVLVAVALAVAPPAAGATPALSVPRAKHAIAIFESDLGKHQVVRCARRSRFRIGCTVREWDQQLQFFTNGPPADLIGNTWEHITITRHTEGLRLRSNHWNPCWVRRSRCVEGD
jgi:hypothetical protein